MQPANLLCFPSALNILFGIVVQNAIVAVIGSFLSGALNIPRRALLATGGKLSMERKEIGLIEGFFLCLCDSTAVRLQPSAWKRDLLVFSSGVCLEIAALPFLGSLIGCETAWPVWLVSFFFGLLGLFGLYASKFGDDRLVESLLVIPKLDLRL